jgi:putative endonuclease
MEQDKHYVYIAECADGTYYTGYTTDVESRSEAHNAGKGAKYTRSRLPVKIVFTEEFESKSDALKREAAIKRLRRSAKAELIGNSDLAEALRKVLLERIREGEASDHWVNHADVMKEARAIVASARATK